MHGAVMLLMKLLVISSMAVHCTLFVSHFCTVGQYPCGTLPLVPDSSVQQLPKQASYGIHAKLMTNGNTAVSGILWILRMLLHCLSFGVQWCSDS